MTSARPDLPTGTVTLLFSDVEGSTRLLHELGPEAYATALHEHHRVLRVAFARHDGVEVDTEGDAFFVAFPDPAEAVAAARDAQEALASGPIRVRMGLHTGTPHLTEQGYVGVDVHQGARIAAAAHGGQVVLSKETRQLLDDGFELLDLGEHRVKDFTAPVWIYQLGAERFPPLKTISNTNLPRPASSFIGRAQEVAELGALLRDGARLVTLTGPGGSGKTRLSIEAAAELVPEFKAGVFWVGLAALRDPELVTATIAQTLGAKDGLSDHIGEREMLLLLDNLEQVVGAAPALAALIEACPNLRLLTTSRELLRVRGEVEYPVLPLAEPEAVDLFCARARAEPDESVRELCRALDNLPLALELAAARASVLSPRQILKRLSGRLDLLKGGRDADPRQQTLRATIAWSYELLSVEEKAIFARLSVFAGGCSLEAAQEIAEGELDTLQSLVDKSLLRHLDERFSMLETIREYAAERLVDSGEANEVRRRHGEYFLALAEAAGSEMWTPGESAALDRIEHDHPNLRAALSRWRDAGETERQLRVAASIWRYWQLRGFAAEGRRWVDPLISGVGGPPGIRHEVLLGAASMAHFQGELERAAELLHEARELAGTLDEPVRLGRSLMELGITFAWQGDVDQADALFEDAEAHLGAPGGDRRLEPVLRARLAANRGDLALIRRDFLRAAEVSVRAVELNRHAGNEHGVSAALLNVGIANAQLGRHTEAMASFRNALQLMSTRGDVFGIELCLRGIAAVLAFEGATDRAARLLGAAEVSHNTIGEELGPAERDLDERARAVLDAAPERDSVQAALKAGHSMDLEAATQYALADA